MINVTLWSRVFCLSVICFLGAALPSNSAVADEIAFSSIVSESGQYQLEIIPGQPVVLSKYLTWSMSVVGAKGAPADVSLKIRGGMRSHGHGLPTSPEIVQVSTGKFEIQGLFFNMPGSWHIVAEMSVPGAPVDFALVEFSIGQPATK